jgi:arylsulfate sulfotransferase
MEYPLNYSVRNSPGWNFFLFLSGVIINTPAMALDFVQSPTLTMNPNGVAPLTGVIQFETDVPARATVNISNGIENWTREFSEYQIQHYLPILGLKPNNHYTVEMVISDINQYSLAITPPLQAITDPLPDDFPSITVLASDPSRMEPGYTLVDKIIRGPVNIPDSQTPDGTLPKYSMILDNTGNIIWYSTLGSINMKQLPNGNISYTSNNDLIETDLLGNIQKTIHLETPRIIHHDVFTESNGKILSLTNKTVEVESYPTSYTDPNAPTENTLITDSPVVEFSSTGALLNQWDLSDLLDPTRIGYLSLSRPNGTSADWSHANAVLHDPDDDSIIVSIRHQDAVIKFSRSTGTLKWILGNHNNWTPRLQSYLLNPVGTPFEWQFHQHAPAILPSGNILLFDNGNSRASPFDGNHPLANSQNYSRAVEYSINEQDMEIRQVWEFGSDIDQRYYSGSRGDADWMPNTENVLITFADVNYVGGVSSNALGMGTTHTRIIEVDHSEAANKVFEVAIYNATPRSMIISYRSERIPDLYPVDSDNDGIADFQDNCVYSANGPLLTDLGGNSQLDSDGDGYGNICDGDLNNDGMVNSQDLGLMKLAFLTSANQSNFNPDADLNGDNIINSLDLGIFKELFLLPAEQ